MGTTTHTTEIDGVAVTISTFKGREAVKMQTALVRMFGPALVSLVGSADVAKFKGANVTDVLEAEVDFNTLAAAVQKLSENVTEDSMLSMLMRLFQYVRIDGREMSEEVFDVTFAGNTTLMYKIAWEVVKVNRFFGTPGTGQGQ